MSTTYTGIDYGHGRSNIDNQTGIRFGVISQGSISHWAMDDVWQNARDLSYEASRDEFKAKLHYIENGDTLARLCDAYGLRDQEIDNPEQMTADELWNELEQEFNDAYSMNDCGEHDWLYESDGYKLTNCLDSDVMVLASPYFTYAQFCSPCVPGACDLDSPLDLTEWSDEVKKHPRAYCLGHDYFENGRAPYPVYSVATGELVAPVE